MSTRYIWILGVQSEPFPIGEDETRRPMFSMNYETRTDSAPDISSANDFIAIVNAASPGLLTLNVDTFIGPTASIPTGDGPYAQFLPTGGTDDDQTHNGDSYPNPTVQLVVRGRSYAGALTRIRLIHSLLHNTRNAVV